MIHTVPKVRWATWPRGATNSPRSSSQQRERSEVGAPLTRGAAASGSGDVTTNPQPVRLQTLPRTSRTVADVSGREHRPSMDVELGLDEHRP